MTKCSPLQKKNLFMLELSTMRLYLDNKRHYINMTYIFFFAFRWMTRNAECNMDPFTIPVHYQQILLPDPACSISELLKFPFPPQAWSSPSNGQYWSSNPPATANVDIDNLKSLTIPGQTSLQHIKEQVYQHYLHWGATSIQYSHLSAGLPLEAFLLWVMTYWVKVSHFWQHVKEPWQHVKLWLTKKWNAFQKPKRWWVCDET